MEIKKHGDFKEYYDENLKRNVWVLGYFGGGAVNIYDAYKIAKQYALENNVKVESVKIDEILRSSRFKGFKYMYSDNDQKPALNAEKIDSVFAWLTN